MQEALVFKCLQQCPQKGEDEEEEGEEEGEDGGAYASAYGSARASLRRKFGGAESEAKAVKGSWVKMKSTSPFVSLSMKYTEPDGKDLR